MHESELKETLIHLLNNIIRLRHLSHRQKENINQTINLIKQYDIPSSPENIKLAFDLFDCVNRFTKGDLKVTKILDVNCTTLFNIARKNTQLQRKF